jgi:uncharacterized protein
MPSDLAIETGTITTYTGRSITPLDPDPADIDIEDIAHALSNSCRFTGHVREFYSVAQHSYLCSTIVPDEYKLTALLHDASEAYLSDIARPIKSQPEFGDVYKKYENQLEAAIAERFGLVFPYPEEIKQADYNLLKTEQRDLMPDRLRAEDADYLEDPISPWAPELAELKFLGRYYSLIGG